MLAVGLLFLGVMVRGPQGDGFAMVSPFFWAGEMAFECCSGRGVPHHMGWGFFWIFIYASAALVFLLATLATFNRAMGRIDAFEHSHWSYRRRKPRQVSRIDSREESLNTV